MLKVFVYGTLKPGECNYARFCEGKVTSSQKCWTKGQLFLLPVGYPAMITGNDKVQGFLLTFSDESILNKLDRLEGYNPQQSPEMNIYQRQKTIVYDELSDEVLGHIWAYFMTEERVKNSHGVLIPSGCWVSGAKIQNSDS